MCKTKNDNQIRQKCSLLILEVSKLLSDMAIDAKNHGFDITPYLAKLAEMNIVDAADANETTAALGRRQ